MPRTSNSFELIPRVTNNTNAPDDFEPLHPGAVQDESIGQQMMAYLPNSFGNPFVGGLQNHQQNHRQDETFSDDDEAVYDEDELSKSDSEDERGGNGLNLHVGYCSHWTLNEAVREVMQNTIDGAVEYMRTKRPYLQRQDLYPAGKIWYTKKMTPTKKFRQAGFLHGGKAEMILSVTPRQGTAPDVPTNKRKWHESKHSYAYICLEFVSRQEIDWDPFENTGKQPEGTILIKCETINRALDSFRIRHLCRIGKTLKSNSRDQAGKFGEGFKVGALVAVRNHVAVDVQGRGRRIKFKIKKRELCFTRHSSNVTKEAREHPRMVFVKLHLTKPPRAPQHEARYHFDVSFFRLLHPGNPFAPDGDVLREPLNKGKIFCMGIFVCQEHNVFLGYDISEKDLVSGRDRNETSKQRLRSEIARLLNRCKQDDEELIPYLLQKMMEVEDEEDLNRGQEVHAVRESAELCNDLSLCFRTKEGEDAFPVKKSEKSRFQESLRNLRPIELLDPLVDILRKGCYRSIEDEVDFLLSDENKVTVTDTEQRLLQSCVFRLNRVTGHFEIDLDSIVIVNSDNLNTKYHNCKVRTDGEGLSKFYIPRDLLLITEACPFLRTSNKLGFSIASKIPSIKVNGMESEDLEDFAFRYGEENDSTSSWFRMQISECEKYVIVCEKVLAEAMTVRVAKDSAEEGNDGKFDLQLREEKVQLPDDLESGEYSFTAVDENWKPLLDPLTQEACRIQLIVIRSETDDDSQSQYDTSAEAGENLVDVRQNPIIEAAMEPLNRDHAEAREPSNERGDIQIEEENLEPQHVVDNQTDDDSGSDFGDRSDDYEEPLDSNEDVADDDFDYPEALNDLTDEELNTIFGQGNQAEDFELRTESSPEDEAEAPKRPRRTLPRDETHAVFSGKVITKGRVYSHINGQDVWYVRVVGFAGRKLPIRRARCHILKPLHSAISSFFNNTENPFAVQHNAPDAGLNVLPIRSGMDYAEVLQSASQWVLEDTKMGSNFMKTLVESDVNFDEFKNTASLETKRKVRKWIEFRRTDLATSDFVPCLRIPRELVLFAGVGGSSLGDMLAGFRVKWLVEKDSLAAASLKGSHPGAIIFEDDVSAFHDKSNARKPGYPKEKRVDHVQASPPCQGFSLANRGGGRNDRKNNVLSLEILRSLAIFKPRTGMLENVQGMLRPQHLKYVYQILHESIALGYQVRLALHNADEFGGAQKRKRVIFTFARNDTLLPELPKATNQSQAETLNDALQGLPVQCDIGNGSGIVRLPNKNLTLTMSHRTPEVMQRFSTEMRR